VLITVKARSWRELSDLVEGDEIRAGATIVGPVGSRASIISVEQVGAQQASLSFAIERRDGDSASIVSWVRSRLAGFHIEIDGELLDTSVPVRLDQALTGKAVILSNPLSTDDLWRQLQNAISLRSTQDQILWQIFGVFWASNAVLLVALVATGHLPGDPVVGLIVAGAGTALCVAWNLIQRRALGHLGRDEKLMAKYERALHVDPAFAVSWDVNREAYDTYVSNGPRARHVMNGTGLFALAFWVILAIYFAAQFRP